MDTSRLYLYTSHIMFALKIAFVANLLLILVFYLVNDVFKSKTKFEITYTTFPQYIRAYELLIALSTGSLVLLITQAGKLIDKGANGLSFVGAAWSFITAIVLSFLFILFLIREVQASEPDHQGGFAQPIAGSTTRFRFCVSMFLAISAVVSFVLGFVYLAESVRLALPPVR